MTCQRWVAYARLYDNGSVSPPYAEPIGWSAYDDDGLLDRTEHRGSYGGYLRICYWGHSEQTVLAAAQARLDEDLAQRRLQGLPTP